MAELSFDQVTIKKSAGVNLISADEWLRIPTLEQFDLIRDRKVEFLLGGERVKVIDAVRSMQGLQASESDPARRGLRGAA
jgi:hypothetical protein